MGRCGGCDRRTGAYACEDAKSGIRLHAQILLIRLRDPCQLTLHPEFSALTGARLPSPRVSSTWDGVAEFQQHQIRSQMRVYDVSMTLPRHALEPDSKTF